MARFLGCGYGRLRSRVTHLFRSFALPRGEARRGRLLVAALEYPQSGPRLRSPLPVSSPRLALAFLLGIVGLGVLAGPASAAHPTATAPVVTRTPASREVKAGHVVSFGARAEGSPKPSVTWQVSTDGGAWREIPGARSGILRFVATSTDAANKYRATFSNAGGDAVTRAATLTVVSSPLALGFAVFDPTYPRRGNQFESYRTAVGKLPNFLEFYQDPWPTVADIGKAGAWAPLYWNEEKHLVRNDHLTALISWGTDNISLRTIVNGATDGEDAVALAPAVRLAKSFPGTLYIRLDWEMNGSWAGWNPTNVAQKGQDESPATFVAMWQHVVNYFRTSGVTNVRWVWSANVDGGGGTMAAYYPGDRYVDDVGLDGYNYAYSQGASWQTPQQIFAASYKELERITHRPVIITETSSVEADAGEAAEGLSKAAWMQQLSVYIPELSNVIALCWFDQPAMVGSKTVNFGVHSSGPSLSAWQRYFVRNPEYRGKLP